MLLGRRRSVPDLTAHFGGVVVEEDLDGRLDLLAAFCVDFALVLGAKRRVGGDDPSMERERSRRHQEKINEGGGGGDGGLRPGGGSEISRRGREVREKKGGRKGSEKKR